MRALTKQQRGAVYLVIATVLTGVGRLIEPGVFVASGTKWHDLVEVRAAMADNAALEHVSSLLYAFGLIVLVEHIEANNFWQAVGVIMGVVLLIWLLATAHAMYKEKIPSATA